MADWHLSELRVALEHRGWRVVEEQPGDDYRIAASWVLERSGQDSNVILDFDGLDDLQVLPLDQAYACHLRGSNAVALYFRRKGSSKRSIWKDELASFVDSIDRSSATAANHVRPA